MVIDSGLVAIALFVLLALLGLAVGWGTLRERVHNIRHDVDTDRKENRADHEKILDSIDEVKTALTRK